MKTMYSMPIKFWATVLAFLLIYQFSTEANADWCKFEKTIEMALDLSGSDELAIFAGAGDLEVTGIPGAEKATIQGKVCASKEAWLEEAQVNTTDGTTAEIQVMLPDTDGGFSLLGGSYAWMDLEISIPDDMPLVVKDSSGDIELRDIASVELSDSSGDIDIKNAGGEVNIRDSSGDMTIEGVSGDFVVENDSSGDIRASGITGSVLVKRDSSGDIRIKQVTKNVTVEKDSSGDISVADVGGDFIVLKDGSGDIRSKDVSGEIQIPDDD